MARERSVTGTTPTCTTAKWSIDKETNFGNRFAIDLYDRIISDQRPDGYWEGQVIHPVYVTACNLIMLQLDHGYLPIYQR